MLYLMIWYVCIVDKNSSWCDSLVDNSFLPMQFTGLAPMQLLWFGSHRDLVLRKAWRMHQHGLLIFLIMQIVILRFTKWRIDFFLSAIASDISSWEAFSSSKISYIVTSLSGTYRGHNDFAWKAVAPIGTTNYFKPCLSPWHL